MLRCWSPENVVSSPDRGYIGFHYLPCLSLALSLSFCVRSPPMADNSEQENFSPKKLQFSLPVLQPRLDPRSLEQIRRRRPTPATLVLLSDLSSPVNEEQTTHLPSSNI
uniref:protein phosphatase 1 regulatory subunit 1A-like n=1 Tax=Myxine glutinosa TaxID=7769 RepID=UPI00358FBB59